MTLTRLIAWTAAVVLAAGTASVAAHEPAPVRVAAHGGATGAEPGPTAEPEPVDASPPTTATEHEATTTTTIEASTPAEETPPLCDPSTITVETRTDKPRYAPGELVTVVSSVTNASGGDCYYPAFREEEIVDEQGRSLRASASAAHPYDTVRWPAGETIVSTSVWDQTVDGEQVAPGSYTATVTWTASIPREGSAAEVSYTAAATVEVAASEA